MVRNSNWSYLGLMPQKWTDARARLLRELLGTMQIIKVFTYEIPFLKRMSCTRDSDQFTGVQLTQQASNKFAAKR